MPEFSGFPLVSQAQETFPLLLMTTDQAQKYLLSLPSATINRLALSGFNANSGDFSVIDYNGSPAALFCYQANFTAETFAPLVKKLATGTWTVSTENNPSKELLEALVLGFGLEGYLYDKSRLAKNPKLLLPEGIDTHCIDLIKASWFARDLINAPANLLSPTDLANKANELFGDLKKDHPGIICEIIQSKALDKGFPALAAVGNGSDRAPCAFIAKNKVSDSYPTVSLVGKGVVFDTGGYDIKPSSGMRWMKKDMGGAATVLALAYLMIKSNLKLNVELRLGCVENSVSGHAMRPGDILNTRKGLTVEVGNTDAEGRLVLSDLLTHATESNPDLILDIATLTGAARVALGPDMPAVFSNDEKLAFDLQSFTKNNTDSFWAMPLCDSYRDWMKSSVADLSNLSAKPLGGAITAALFLENFINDTSKWVHIDSFGWNDSSKACRPQGGEPLGLRGLYDWFKQMRFKTVLDQ